jgi:Sensors of blue-light using FAD
MHAIAYVSSATDRLFTPDHLDQLLMEIRIQNATLGVTGVLLHHDGNFLQYIEGPAASIKQAYARIQRSNAHHGIIELLNEPIHQRHFTQWTMGFAQPPRTTLQEIAQASWIDEVRDISQNTANPGLILLMEFWNRNNVNLGGFKSEVQHPGFQ